MAQGFISANIIEVYWSLWINYPCWKTKKRLFFQQADLKKLRFIHDFHKPLKENLKQKGFDIIGEFSCRGFDTSQAAKIIGGLHKGRPDEEDLKQAEHFARGLEDTI